MDSFNSLTNFFYNIVPGVLLIVSIDKYTAFKILTYFGKDDPLKLLLIIALGLFIGFAFQAFTKIARDSGINHNIFRSVKDKDSDTYEKAINILETYDVINKNGEEDLEKEFHIMDNYLRGKKQAELIDHFASKAAFWGNVFFGIAILLFLSLIKLANIEVPMILTLLFLAGVSFYMSWKYWGTQYNIVMKSFVAVVKIDRENNQKTRRSR